MFYLLHDYLYRFSMLHWYLGLLYVNADSIVTWRSFDSVHLIIKSMPWRTDAVFKMFFIHYNLYQVKRNIFLGVVSLVNNNNRYRKYIQTWKIFQLDWYICNTSSVSIKCKPFFLNYCINNHNLVSFESTTNAPIKIVSKW